MRDLLLVLVVFLASCGGGGGSGSPDADGDAAGDVETEASDDPLDDPVEDPEEEDGPTLGRLGDPCTSPADCEGDICIVDLLFPGFDDGYCSQTGCDAADPDACAPDGVCLDFGSSSFPTLCVKTCTSDTDCRTGYACVGMCIPDDFVSDPGATDVLDPSDASILAALALIDEARMRSRIEILSGEAQWDSPSGLVTISSRAVLHPDHATALDYLEAELTAMGMTVTRLSFDVEGHTHTNLSARLDGTDTGLDPIHVSAHLDSTAKRTSPWDETSDAAPGASDNGSGLAVTLEIADILTSLSSSDPFPRSVVFLLFDAEELGLYGSVDYVDAMVTAGDAHMCTLNTDMFGWDPVATPGRFWYEYHATHTTTAAFDQEAIATFVPSATVIPSSSEYLTGSDHASYWDAGYCAVSLGSYPPDPYYHTVDDTLSTYDWPFFVDVVESSVAIAAAWVYRWSD